jgi:protein involved in polysaccharide export with SLBB domain
VEFKSKVLYVFGQVDEPGVKPFTGHETVLNLVAEARLNQYAWPQKIVIVRPNDDPTVRQKVTVDIKEMFQTGNTTNDFVLEEGDLIYVPPSPLAQVSLTFKKLMGPIQPTLGLATMVATGGVP